MDFTIDLLFQYGVLGLWTAYLVYKEFKQWPKFSQAISNNTTATNRMSSLVELLIQEHKDNGVLKKENV